MQIYCRTIGDAGKKEQDRALSGSAHISVLGVLMVVFVIGGGYLYSVNQSAVQGYHMRALEKEIGVLKQDNANLKVAEADLKSLYRIETAETDLQMQKVESAIYIDERDLVSMSQSNESSAVLK